MIPSKEELNMYYVDECLTIEQLKSKYNVEYRIIRKWLKNYDIKTFSHKTKIVIPSRSDLFDTYLNKCKTIKELAKIYGVGTRTIYKWFSFYNIKPIRSVERKYYHLRQIPFTQIQKEFLVGTMLGDGHLGGSKLKRFTAVHGSKQKDYLEWKRDILSDFVMKIYITKQVDRNCISHSFVSISHQDFNEIYDLFYHNGKKIIKYDIYNYLTPFGLAIWYMDDGSTRKYDMKLCTCGFSYDENLILKDILLNKFNIDVKVKRYKSRDNMHNYLTINKENSVKLTKIIAPYVTIDCMKYKLLKY